MIIRSNKGGAVQMKSMELEFETGGQRCLSFWYSSFGKIKLNIHNAQGVQRFIPITETGVWQYRNESIHLAENDNIIFQTDFTDKVDGGVAIDDVSLSHKSCGGEFIDFENVCNDI